MGLEGLGVNHGLAGRLVQGAIVVAMLGGYPWLVREAGGDDEGLLAAAYHTMLLLLALWTFFVPWYVAWAIPWAALGSRRAGRQVLLLSGVALLSYVIQFSPNGRKDGGVGLRSTLSALLIFVPLLLSLLPWDRLRRSWWARRAVRRPPGLAPGTPVARRGEDSGLRGGEPLEGSAE
jgi:hypothetical protein